MPMGIDASPKRDSGCLYSKRNGTLHEAESRFCIGDDDQMRIAVE